jgi:hypothetical protein
LSTFSQPSNWLAANSTLPASRLLRMRRLRSKDARFARTHVPRSLVAPTVASSSVKSISNAASDATIRPTWDDSTTTGCPRIDPEKSSAPSTVAFRNVIGPTSWPSRTSAERSNSRRWTSTYSRRAVSSASMSSSTVSLSVDDDTPASSRSAGDRWNTHRSRPAAAGRGHDRSVSFTAY